MMSNPFSNVGLWDWFQCAVAGSKGVAVKLVTFLPIQRPEVEGNFQIWYCDQGLIT